MDCTTILWTVGLEETEKSQSNASAAKFVDVRLANLDSIIVSDCGLSLVRAEDSGTCGPALLVYTR